jgi:hypothetical protein
MAKPLAPDPQEALMFSGGNAYYYFNGQIYGPVPKEQLSGYEQIKSGKGVMQHAGTFANGITSGAGWNIHVPENVRNQLNDYYEKGDVDNYIRLHASAIGYNPNDYFNWYKENIGRMGNIGTGATTGSVPYYDWNRENEWMPTAGLSYDDFAKFGIQNKTQMLMDYYDATMPKSNGFSLKKIAGIALPILGTILAPGIGTALGSTLTSTALSTIGGALGGGLGGAISGGGLKGAATGAVMGGVGGYISGGGTIPGLGSIGGATGAGGMGPITPGTGIFGSAAKALGMGAYSTGPNLWGTAFAAQALMGSGSTPQSAPQEQSQQWGASFAPESYTAANNNQAPIQMADPTAEAPAPVVSAPQSVPGVNYITTPINSTFGSNFNTNRRNSWGSGISFA